MVLNGLELSKTAGWRFRLPMRATQDSGINSLAGSTSTGFQAKKEALSVVGLEHQAHVLERSVL